MGQILHRNATTTNAVRLGTLPSQRQIQLARVPPLGRLGLD